MDAERQRNALCCELVHSVARSCGEVRLKVTGSSMLPTVWPGDEITVVRCKYTELQIGQIVLYHRDGGLTAHRIKHVVHDHVIAQGDSLSISDPPVLPGEIVGRVVSILRNGRGVQPEHSLLSHIVSLALCRSDLSRRIILYLIRRMGRRSDEMQASWVNP